MTRKFHGSACCGSQQKALAGNATGGPKSTCALLLIALEIAGPGKEALAGNRCNMLLQLHPFTLFRHRWEDRLKILPTPHQSQHLPAGLGYGECYANSSAKTPPVQICLYLLGLLYCFLGVAIIADVWTSDGQNLEGRRRNHLGKQNTSWPAGG